MAEERSCKNCKRDCPFVEGYDHAPFEAHFHQIGPKTFVCVSWTDDSDEKRVETEQVGPGWQPREE